MSEVIDKAIAESRFPHNAKSAAEWFEQTRQRVLREPRFRDALEIAVELLEDKKEFCECEERPHDCVAHDALSRIEAILKGESGE